MAEVECKDLEGFWETLSVKPLVSSTISFEEMQFSCCNTARFSILILDSTAASLSD